MIKRLALFFLVFILFSCGSDPLPKPKAMLRLEYPNSQYTTLENPCPFNFQVNELATVNSTEDCFLELSYPKLKATIHITYKQVQDNIEKLLRDAQNLTYEHDIKADYITEQPFINNENGSYGMFYEVGGNAASQSQFYITDSTKHFLTGSLYFLTKPNYDSILPAADYLKKDMRRIMESLRWKEIKK